VPTVLRLDDINPDGIRIWIDWRKMEVGASIFIPCLNVSKAKTQLLKIAEEKGMTLKITPCIDGGKWGIRVWRTC
jgi:hypothetical protein